MYAFSSIAVARLHVRRAMWVEKYGERMDHSCGGSMRALTAKTRVTMTQGECEAQSSVLAR